ncbi:hypothetical protein BC940DRAFT_288980 [Gongronella butleri]|nr:hypothetical protein BC940DRAFT_288980 [Gongronella butleri]
MGPTGKIFKKCLVFFILGHLPTTGTGASSGHALEAIVAWLQLRPCGSLPGNGWAAGPPGGSFPREVLQHHLQRCGFFFRDRTTLHFLHQHRPGL